MQIKSYGRMSLNRWAASLDMRDAICAAFQIYQTVNIIIPSGPKPGFSVHTLALSPSLILP